jgi:2-phospho-L-lactate guanylyltransferase
VTAPGPVVAVVPVRALEGAKSRLGDALDAGERRDLVARLLARTLDALAPAAGAGVGRTIVVSGDDAVLALARRAGTAVVPLRQRGSGLNPGLEEARAVALELGAASLLVLPADLADPATPALAGLIAARPDGASVVLAPDRHGEGTNALLLTPPGAIDFSFGPGSRAAHRAAATAAGVAYVELDGPLALDLDTPEDLRLAAALGIRGLPGSGGSAE